MPTPITLKVFRGGKPVRTERFDREIIKIGRLPSTHLCLQDEKISRLHSAIEVSPDGSISIVDMGSAAGTFVNGERVLRASLRYGDQITLGGLTIVVEGAGSDGAPAETSAPSAVATPAGDAPSAVVPEAELEPPRAPAPTRDAAPEPSVRPSVEDLPDESDVGVEVRIAWGGALLQSDTFVRPRKPVLVGETRNCAMHLEGLSASESPVLRWQDGEYRFTFPRGMTGVVEEEGARTTFSDLVASHAAVSDDTESGYSIAVPRAGAVRAEVGSRLSIEMRATRLKSVRPAPFWERIDYPSVNLFLVLSFLQACFIVAAYDFPYDTDVVADELLENPGRMARFVVEPSEPQPGEARAQRQPALARRSEASARHGGEEGATGQKRAPTPTAQHRPRAIDPNARDVASAGVVGILRRSAGSLSTVFDSGGLGGDLQATISGGMSGPVVADGQGGFGGLGIRGSGTGTGDGPMGIGDIDTKWAGEGKRAPIDVVLKKSARDTIIEVTPDVRGSVDKELIRKVIRDHADQIRYCYEQRLRIDPRLHGKVAIRWTIQADGSATDPKVDDSITTVDDPGVHACMMSRIASWTFPKPRGGGVAIVTYPWILRVSGAEQ